jgi:NADPH2:quinone reductase
MRAVQITRFGGPEVLDVVDTTEPEPGPGQQLYDVSTAGVDHADAHHLGAPGGVRAILSSAPL